MNLRAQLDWSKAPMYVPCDNPLVKSLMNYSHERRYHWASEFEVFERDGKRYCAWCNQRETASGRHKYCSDECRVSCDMFNAPCAWNGFGYLFGIQKGYCRTCNHDWVQYYDKDEYINRTIKRLGYFNPFNYKHLIPKEYRPEMDHIIPVACGGPILGHDNIQMICYTCHKVKTKKDMVEIRNNPCPEYVKRKREAKAQLIKDQEAYDDYLKQRGPNESFYSYKLSKDYS